jgi:hypothetical protein
MQLPRGTVCDPRGIRFRRPPSGAAATSCPFLLEEDAEGLVHEAEVSTVLRPSLRMGSLTHSLIGF